MATEQPRLDVVVPSLELSEGSSPAMPARLLLLRVLFRGLWLTVEGSRGRRRHSAASPGRTGRRGRVGRRGR